MGKPDFDISSYTKIMLVGVGVAYTPTKNRGRSERERQLGGPSFIDDDTRADFEELVRQVFTEEMQKSERFELVRKAGTDVLEIRGSLMDVESYVPEDRFSRTAGQTNIFTTSVGAATLVLELRDSESGTFLARSMDRRAAEPMGGSMIEANRATSAGEVTVRLQTNGTDLRLD